MSDQEVSDRIKKCSGWLVQKQLGRGQYGTAYLVEWSLHAKSSKTGANDVSFNAGDQAVAKVVGLEFLPEKEHTLAFQEVELMRQLRHPHIVSLMDHFLTGAGLELCIVMDFCDSGDLRGEVKKRARSKPICHIPEQQVMAWFVQLTLALNYIHHRHILHRDLKSSNIFLNRDKSPAKAHVGGFDVKIGDFGIARVLEGTIDVAATVVGTPYYMSPEVCKSEPYGYKSDIWALGCVLYEMCMLKHAFESQSLLGLVYKIVSDTYDPIPHQYSEDLRALLDRVLDKSHFQRPSGKQLIADGYVKRFVQAGSQTSIAGTPSKPCGEGNGARQHRQSPPPRTSLQPSRMAPQVTNSLGPWRGTEPTPLPPDAVPIGRSGSGGPQMEEEPVRRQWTSQTIPAGPARGVEPTDEGQLRVHIILRRICVALSQRRQNWLQVFASFDSRGDGQLDKTEFEQALTSMALGLSDAEIQELCDRLQGSVNNYVAVDRFGALLHHAPQVVLRLEEWGRSVLVELVREASQASTTALTNSKAVALGAYVWIQGLTSAVGKKLNGSEGFVEKWDPQTCRWVVKIKGTNDFKSIRDEQLMVLHAPAGNGNAASGGTSDTTALYRLLCEGGDQAVPEERFMAIVSRYLPQLSDTDRKKLVPLLPKTQDGRIDAPEVLARLVTSTALMEQTARMAGPPLDFGAASALSPGSGTMAPRRSPVSSAPGLAVASTANGTRPLPHGLPGAVISPRPGIGKPSPLSDAVLGLDQRSGDAFCPSAPPPRGHERVQAEVALLRLANRLIGVQQPGPGVDVLRLFAQPSHIDEIRLEELLDAASVLPLGISRAEVQSVFAHLQSLTGKKSDTLQFSAVSSAAEAAQSAGVSRDVGISDVSKLTAALNRLASFSGGRASPQDFRFTMMQAEPYLTPGQLEWLMMLTDKDGEGRLLPKSLLARLSGHPERHRGADGVGVPAHVLVPPRPACAVQGPVARNTPRAVVVGATLARIHDRLKTVGGQQPLQLDRVFGLFELDAESRMSRATLASLLGHLRLAISAAEADEVVNFLVGTSAGGAGAGGTVPIVSLYQAQLRAGDPEAEAKVSEMRDAAREILNSKGDCLAMNCLQSTAGSDTDWLSEVDFRRCLASSMSAGSTLDDDAADRLLLLAEKNALGEIRWKEFARNFAAWDELDSWSEAAWMSPKSPATGKRMFAATPVRLDAPMQSGTQQSWRSAKLQEASRAHTQAAAYPSDKELIREESDTAVDKHVVKPNLRCNCAVS